MRGTPDRTAHTGNRLAKGKLNTIQRSAPIIPGSGRSVGTWTGKRERLLIWLTYDLWNTNKYNVLFNKYKFPKCVNSTCAIRWPFARPYDINSDTACCSQYVAIDKGCFVSSVELRLVHSSCQPEGLGFYFSLGRDLSWSDSHMGQPSRENR